MNRPAQPWDTTIESGTPYLRQVTIDNAGWSWSYLLYAGWVKRLVRVNLLKRMRLTQKIGCQDAMDREALLLTPPTNAPGSGRAYLPGEKSYGRWIGVLPIRKRASVSIIHIQSSCHAGGSGNLSVYLNLMYWSGHCFSNWMDCFTHGDINPLMWRRSRYLPMP